MLFNMVYLNIELCSGDHLFIDPALNILLAES
jgi:hypothetical protein